MSIYGDVEPDIGDTILEVTRDSARISLRDWFAGQALAGLISAGGPQALATLLIGASESESDGVVALGRLAYLAADGMLDARKKNDDQRRDMG